MFEFIKKIFTKKVTNPVDTTSPILVHVDIGESIVVKEVALTDVTPKSTKRKVSKLKEVKPAEITPIAKGVKPAIAKKTSAKKPKSEPAKIVQLVQPIPTKKKGRPKKDTTV